MDKGSSNASYRAGSTCTKPQGVKVRSTVPHEAERWRLIFDLPHAVKSPSFAFMTRSLQLVWIRQLSFSFSSVLISVFPTASSSAMIVIVERRSNGPYISHWPISFFI